MPLHVERVHHGRYEVIFSGTTGWSIGFKSFDKCVGVKKTYLGKTLWETKIDPPIETVPGQIIKIDLEGNLVNEEAHQQNF